MAAQAASSPRFRFLSRQRQRMFSTRPPRGRPPPCASIWDNFVHRDADDASGAESRVYLGARALDTRERYTSEKLATRGRGGVFSMPTKKVVIPRARVTQSRLPRRCKHARRRQLLGGRRGTVASGRLHHGRRSPARGLRSAALKHSGGPGRELFSRFHACKRPPASPTLSFLNLDYLLNLFTE